ncbi:MAG: TldD/PmbA family protein [Synergistaceae bacterium]|nr:TldD/PmbA family protein [Synergistaceae bacterium]
MSVGDAPRREIESVGAWMLDRAMSMNGVTGADVLYYFSRSHTLSLRDGEPEENASGVSGGIGLRCLGKDGRQGVAFGNNLSRTALVDVIEWSHANCMNSEPEEGIFLYSGSLDDDAARLEISDAEIMSGIGTDWRMRECLAMTAEAKGLDERVVSVRAASWGDGYAKSFYASTSGISGWRAETSASCGVAVVMNSGDSFEMGSSGNSARYLSDLDGLYHARTSVNKTRTLMGGKPLATGKYTVAFEPEIAAMIVGEVGELFCSSDIHKGRSLMKGKLGKSVASGAVSLVDDGRMSRGMGSSPFDGEGVPTGKTVLIEAGTAVNYLYNLQYASKDGVNSTGNASRSIGSLPDVGTSNLLLLPGQESRESMIRGISNGFLVSELMGLHTLDPISGDFSLGAKGVRISGGVPGEPVAGVTIAGNLLDLLMKVTAVGSDVTFFRSIGAPTIVVEGVSVAGGSAF